MEPAANWKPVVTLVILNREFRHEAAQIPPKTNLWCLFSFGHFAHEATFEPPLFARQQPMRPDPGCGAFFRYWARLENVRDACGFDRRSHEKPCRLPLVSHLLLERQTVGTKLLRQHPNLHSCLHVSPNFEI